MKTFKWFGVIAALWFLFVTVGARIGYLSDASVLTLVWELALLGIVYFVPVNFVNCDRKIRYLALVLFVTLFFVFSQVDMSVFDYLFAEKIRKIAFFVAAAISLVVSAATAFADKKAQAEESEEE